MSKEFCPQCKFRDEDIAGMDCTKILAYCYYQGDKVLEPFEMTLVVKGKEEKVIVLGENDIDNRWILSDGSRIHKEAKWIKNQ